VHERGMIITGKKRSTLSKTSHGVTFYTNNTTRNVLG